MHRVILRKAKKATKRISGKNSQAAYFTSPECIVQNRNKAIFQTEISLPASLAQAQVYSAATLVGKRRESAGTAE